MSNSWFQLGWHLQVMRSSPMLGCVLGGDPAWNSLPPPPLYPPLLTRALFLKTKWKNTTKIFIAKQSEIYLRIHFVDNLCLIIRNLFLISSMFLVMWFLYFHRITCYFKYFKLLPRMVSGFQTLFKLPQFSFTHHQSLIIYNWFSNYSHRHICEQNYPSCGLNKWGPLK